jgi:uncharacterized membrane protein YciS (DUF1049 family)
MRLHPVAIFLIAVATIESAAAIVTIAEILATMGFSASTIARAIPTLTYALGWFGTAAMVELLYRIWRTLQEIAQQRTFE